MDNGTAFENGHVTENDATVPSGEQLATKPVLMMDYSTDFPSLPVNVPVANTSAASAWRPRPVASKTVTITFTLPSDVRANRVKSFGSTSEESKRVQSIAAATECRIETSESKDGSLTVIIKGLRAKAEDARARIVRELQTQTSLQINIPKEHHGKLIGKEGSALKQLEAETNCRIQVPTRDQATDVISIVGPREGIEKAAAYIKALSEREAKLATEHIVCPRAYFVFIRGPFNETFDRITTETGAKINIPPSHVNNEVITVTGEREGVLKAAATIRAIIKEKEAKVKTVTCQVAKAQHRYIIGQSRKGINEILKLTGVSVEVPNEDENSDVITLRGEPAKFPEALALVLGKASSVITQKIDCPQWLHKYLIGPKGATLQSLVENRDKLQLDFDDNGFIYFEGGPEVVKPAFETLSKEVDRLKREMSIEKIKVHPSLHRHVIGRGGSLISKIKEDSGVQISIPNEETNSDEITVEGKTEGVKKAVREIRAIVSKIENEKSKDIIIEQRLHKLIIGSKGSEVAKIRDQFPNVSLAFPDVNKKSDVVNIRGDKTEVDAVYKMLTKITKDLLESNYQQSVPIFKEFHKNIIGKGGHNIRRIRDETHTRIDLPDGSTGEDRILITGKKANVEKAIQELEKIQNELASIVVVDLDIPVKVQSRLLGNGRRLIQSIEQECGGVHIKFPAKSESTKVTIRGPKDDAARAEKLLSELAKDKEQNLYEDNVAAKPEFHRFLIGKAGSKIKQLVEKYDVRIMFPRESDSDKETIHLLGKKDDVLKVKKEFEESIKQLNELVELKLEVDPKHHRHFVIRGAAVLKEIQEQNGGVSISFPKSGVTEGASTVTIKGSKQCAESAKIRIEEIVDDLDHYTSMTVEIPHQHHGRLLRGGAEKVQQIQSKYGVQIRFPRRDCEPSEADKVTISGRDTKCEAAREDLFALVPISRSISVPIDAHKFLIGTGGETVKKIMNDNDVKITIPSKKEDEEPSDEIIVSGELEHVEAALEDIRAKVQEYEANAEDRRLKSFEVVIEVPSEYHQRIIGPKGSTINALRERHEVQIAIPRGEQAGDNITITGYEANARACASEIEDMIAHIRSMFTQEISLAAGYHPRLIGSRGKNLKAVMEKYDVEIRIPRDSADPNLVIIAGKTEDNVYDCIDYLRGEEEEWLAENHEREQYRVQRVPEPVAPKPTSMQIQNAPWQMDMEQFPDMGSAAPVPTQTVGGAWGGPRRW